MLAIGALLLLLALGAFLFSWRTALVAVIAMASSLLAAILVLSWSNATFNSMIVAGLVLALVVVIDEAVGDAENVARRLRERPADGSGGPGPAALVVREAVIEMRGAGLAVLLISLVVFVPVFFTRGAFGAFFPSIAVSYAAAVVVSTLVALLVTPAVGLTLLAKAPLGSHEGGVVRWLHPRYERGVSRVVGSAPTAFVLVGIILVIGLASIPFLGRSFTPDFKDTDLLVRLSGTPGTSLTEMGRITALLGREIRDIPGVLTVGGHEGRALLSDQVVGTEGSELWITVAPDADYDATRASIEEVVHGYPGLERDVVTYPSARIEEVLSGSDDPIAIRVFGQGLTVLRSKAEEVKQALSGIEVIEDLRVAAQSEEPTLEIEVDLDAAERYEIVPGDVRRAAATLLSGIQVGSLFDEQKVFDVVVWGIPEVRHDLSSVEDTADRSSRGWAGAARGCRDRADRILSHRDPARGRLPEHRRHGSGVGAGSRAPSSTTSDGDSGRSSSRWSITRRSSGTSRSARRQIEKRGASPSAPRSPSSSWCRLPSATGALPLSCS